MRRCRGGCPAFGMSASLLWDVGRADAHHLPPVAPPSGGGMEPGPCCAEAIRYTRLVSGSAASRVPAMSVGASEHARH
jgi:hypothetical protein